MAIYSNEIVKATEEEVKEEVKTEEQGVPLTDEELSSVAAGREGGFTGKNGDAAFFFRKMRVKGRVPMVDTPPVPKLAGGEQQSLRRRRFARVYVREDADDRLLHFFFSTSTSCGASVTAPVISRPVISSV